MRSIVCGAAILAALTAGLAAGPAAAGTWSAAYGATIVSTYADGHVVKVYVEPNHTFKIMTASGDTLSGTWRDSGDQSCFTITAPAAAAGGAPSCLPVKDYQLGDGFDGQDATGAYHGVIVAGR